MAKKEPKEKKVKTEEEEEDFLDEKKSKRNLKKEYGEKSTFQKVANIVLWIILLLWMGICLIDFINVHNEDDPRFCIKSGTTQYDDGDVKWCLGLGYKIYNYNRASFNAIEFGPFWSKDRSVKAEK